MFKPYRKYVVSTVLFCGLLMVITNITDEERVERVADTDDEVSVIVLRQPVTEINHICNCDSICGQDFKNINGKEGIIVPEYGIKVLDDSDRPSTKPFRVLLMAAYRTGSSFTAELFNQNDDFFYAFEPGRLLTKCMIKETVPESLFDVRHVEMLDNMFRCDFDNMGCYLKTLANSSFSELRGDMKKITEEQCGQNPGVDTPCRSQALSPPKLNKRCDSKTHIAIKTIRVRQISSVIHLTKENDLNLKIVQLIRDPRGRLSSWLEMKGGRKSTYNADDIDRSALNTADTYCKRWVENYIIGRTMTEEGSLTNSYAFVRYEDMAEHPHSTAEKLYRDIGLELPAEVREWLDRNTIDGNGQRDKYGTSRNSKEAAQNWRNKLTFDAAKLVESLESCTQMMDAFGYKIGFNETIYSDRNYSLVDKVPNFYPKLYFKKWIYA